MKWLIPAKTFLVGEYAALQQQAAILLTTTPCFELDVLSGKKGVVGIAATSPAGRYWQAAQYPDYALSWFDPYQEAGGMGASSAQFLAVYHSVCHLQQKPYSLEGLLEAYFAYAWNGEGIAPSGYDVIAQTQQDCVYINRQQQRVQNYTWPFKTLSFLLVHTGTKTATHQHLQSLTTQYKSEELAAIVEQAQQAFVLQDEQKLIAAVNAYHQQLLAYNLVAEHSLQQMADLQQYKDILALKGCGAMGADVLLLILARQDKKHLSNQLEEAGWKILASEEQLFIK